MSDKILCDVYKTAKKEEMYLFVAQKDGLSRIPSELNDLFVKPIKAMTLVLTAEKKLGRADVLDVMTAINDQGFYLQMPPARETEKLDLFCRRDNDE